MSNETGSGKWRRDCKMQYQEKIGCTEHPMIDHPGVVVDECICDYNFCNTEMGPIPETTTTTKTTTTEGDKLVILFKCYLND